MPLQSASFFFACPTYRWTAASLILLASLTLAASCSHTQPLEPGHEDAAAKTKAIEERIRKDYDPKAEYAKPPSIGELVEGVDLQGTWSTPGGLSCAAVTFTKRSAGKFSAEFQTGGCLDYWALNREATYCGSTITFDRPVMEYSPVIYTRMYTLRFEGTVYLIASERIANFQKYPDPHLCVYNLMKRRPDKATQRDH